MRSRSGSCHKVAHCISGQARTFPSNFRNIKSKFLDTFRQRGHVFAYMTVDGPEQYRTTLAALHEIGVVAFRLETSEANVSLPQLRCNVSSPPLRYKGQFNQAQSLERCFELIRQHEIRTGACYTVVSRIRPDLDFCRRAPGEQWFQAVQKPMTVYFAHFNAPQKHNLPTDVVPDQFALMPRTTAALYFNVISMMHKCPSQWDARSTAIQCRTHRQLAFMQPHGWQLTLECLLAIQLRTNNITVKQLQPQVKFQLRNGKPFKNSIRFACKR